SRRGGSRRAVVFELQLPGGVQRGEVVEEDSLPELRRLRIDEVGGFHFLQREEALPFPRLPNRSGDRVSLPQVEASNLRWGNVDVVRAGLVVGVGAAQKAKAVRKQLQNPFRVDLEPLVGNSGKDCKNQVLLLEALSALDVQVVRHLGQLGDLHPLQVHQL